MLYKGIVMRKQLKWTILPALCCVMIFFGGLAASAEEPGWAERLAQADGVAMVEEIPLDDTTQFFHEKYLVTFEQPLDWNDPEQGSFPQRVVVGLRENAPVNVLGTNGYYLRDAAYGDSADSLKLLKEENDTAEIALILGGSYISVEHRFFGKSKPEDLSYDDLRYWEYFTAENSAADYHQIYQSLSPLLGDRWISTGVSRGGEMTNVYGYYYPEDMLVYVPYVAPCSQGPWDNRMYRFIYTQIGDDVLGPEKAEEYRSLITAFQVDLMRYKEQLLPAYEKAAAGVFGAVFREQARIEWIYDVNVLEFAVQFWQYQRISIDDLKRAVEMPETTAEEIQRKIQTEIQLLLSIQTPADWAVNVPVWPYYVNTATTYGQYYFDFSWLRNALEEAGIGETLSVTEEMEKDILWDIVFTPEQKTAFAFDGTFTEALASSVDTTTAKHLMIFGASDPWSSLRVPETDNPNVRVFVHPTAPHSAMISTMPEEMKNEAVRTLIDWLTEEGSSDGE